MSAEDFAMTEAEARFWRKVRKPRDESKCWVWTANTNPDGYGRFWISGHTESAHRFAWTITYGSIPNGVSVLHHCDNSACVRPDHLFLGTQRDNIEDAKSKGRLINPPSFNGEDHPRAKLTQQDVERIRENYLLSEASQRDLARAYGVSQRAIGKILRGETWTT